jgi:fibro-slime domain-containing protein
MRRAHASALAALCLAPASAAQTLPDTITLSAVVRDFQEWNVPGGHPDFERSVMNRSGGITASVVRMNSEGRLDFLVGTKIRKVGTGNYRQWEDAARRPISLYMATAYPLAGDRPGELDPAAVSDFTTAANFAQWFSDVPGVNLSTVVTLTLNRQRDDTYVIDSSRDEPYRSLHGFFPIDGRLFGNSQSNRRHNFHFTTEVHATFRYDRAANQVFQFTGDDDFWAFVNGEPVVELGGTHSAQSQVVELNRMSSLVDGRVYSLDIFHAERQTDSSNFRMQTNFVLADDPQEQQITGSGD